MTSRDHEMAHLQETTYVEDYDYDAGSPHLRHPSLRRQIVGRIRECLADQFRRTGRCRVLEVGAGHGTFTEVLAASGAEVTVTEMSRPSLDRLRSRFATNPSVRLIYDAEGESVFSDDARYDLVLCVSVLHHIPDYLSFVERVSARVDEGGTFASFQDPLWYPRRGRLNLGVDRAAYFAWRSTQGDLRRALATRTRRARGILDESNPADMVEYHVVRQGVDEQALSALLESRFGFVEAWAYWSTQMPLLQALGSRTGARSTFGLIAQSRRPLGQS